MKNIDQWQPTKFVRTPRGLRGSRNPKHVGVGSEFISDILAQNYERAILAHASGRLLDLGCGHVPLYGVYRDRVSENICVDWENTMHANPFLDATADLNEDLPLPPSSFDTVLLTDVLEHLAEPLRAMQRIAAILRPGGKLILGVPFFYILHEVPHDYYRYTEFALRRFCQLSGLAILELSAYGGLPEILIDLTSKGILVLPQWLAKPLRPIHTAVAALSGIPVSHKISEWTRPLFPLGYLLVAQKTVV